MLSDLLNLLRFITDSETRKILANISELDLVRQKNWQKYIRVARAKFRGSEPHKVSAFASYIFSELNKTGVAPKKIEEFRVVFTELVRNAFEHGCKHAKNCRISVHCTYSRWFIRLQISDSGKGFNLEEELRFNRFHRGLQVATKLSYSLQTNARGNTVTAFLLGYETIEVTKTLQEYKGYEIVVLNLRSDAEWHYANADWEPLLQAVENLGSNLILIDGARLASFASGEWRGAELVFDEFKVRKGQFYAFVVDSEDAKLFWDKAMNMDSDNVWIFIGDRWDGLMHLRAIEQAKEWLIECAKLYPQK